MINWQDELESFLHKYFAKVRLWSLNNEGDVKKSGKIFKEALKEFSDLLSNRDKELREQVEGWKPFTSAPKDREILVVFPKQGDVVQLVNYNNVHGYWQSKGKPQLGLSGQTVYWIDIPVLNLLRKETE